jgi:uncharacterized membrane protein YedE/YeeE
MAFADIQSIQQTVVWSGLGLGALLGATMQRSHFCTMGAIADVVNFGDWSRAKMWVTAVAIAMMGLSAMTLSGWIQPAQSIYAGDRFLWLSASVGGLCFGFGMVLAGGCGSRTLVKLGSGSLKAVVVFVVLGLVAYMTLRGVLGVMRVNTLERIALPLSNHSLLVSVSAWVGVAVSIMLLLAVVATRQGRSTSALLGGALVGLIAAAAWFVSGKLGYVPADLSETLEEAYVGTNSGRVEALSFVAPVAYVQDLLILWSDKSRVATFGVTTVIGVVFGAMASALAGGSFRWEGFASTEDLANHLVGAALMGFGGVVAGGCTVGQGISGLSALSLTAMVATCAIVAGAWLAIKYQERRIEAMV